MREFSRLIMTPFAMRVEHAWILALTPALQDPSWTNQLSVSPRAAYRLDFRRCDVDYALEPQHFEYPASAQQVAERLEPLAFAEPVTAQGPCLGLSTGPGRPRICAWMHPIRP